MLRSRNLPLKGQPCGLSVSPPSLGSAVRGHGKRHPPEMGAAEVEAFLAHLAVSRRVAATTQNQALNAILFLFKEVLGMELAGIDATGKADTAPAHGADSGGGGG